MQATWWVIFGVLIVLYVLLAGYFLPKFFFKPKYKAFGSLDRGINNFKEKDGRSIVYESQKEYKKYISQYILSERGGRKVVMCKTAENFSCIDYDVAAFDCDGKVFDVINVQENLDKSGYTRLVELPPRTVYISLKINAVNNQKTDARNANDSKARHIINRKNALFFAAVSLLAVLVIFGVKLCLANIFGGVFKSDFMTSVVGILITFGIGLVAAAANTAVVVLLRKSAYEL